MKNISLRPLALLALGATLSFGSFALADPGPGGKGRPFNDRQWGQSGPRGGRMGGRFGERMADRLGLTDAQKKKLKGVMESSRKSRDSIFTNTKLSPDQKMTKLKALREKTNQQFLRILNADQRRKFEKMRQERRKRFEQGGPMGGPNGRGPRGNGRGQFGGV